MRQQIEALPSYHLAVAGKQCLADGAVADETRANTQFLAPLQQPQQ